IALLELNSGMASFYGFLLPEIEEGYAFCKVFQTISIALSCSISCTLKYLLWRRRFAHLVPGKPPRFFNLLGNLGEMSFTEK
ncbi:hypothetical protein TNIN_473731, partial [Trichonephila inaurata madagascariensis]